MNHMNAMIYTIGHSNHPIDEFIKILQAYEIGLVVDVRTIPGSRHNPKFNQSEFERELQCHDIGYTHLKGLGGLRHTTKTSINTGWENSSFRGFADYMQTEAFQAGIEQLIELARKKPTVIVCAEAVPWRCHRSLIADALLVRNLRVQDIISEKTSKAHKITPWAKVDGTTITYPGISQTAQETEMVDDLLESHSAG
jgi:uncharacterized protein (DUF488 family)